MELKGSEIASQLYKRRRDDTPQLRPGGHLR